MLRRFVERLTESSQPVSLNLEQVARTQQLDAACPKLLEQLNRSEIPPPDPPLTPILIASRWISHDLYNEDMPAIAADMLGAGYETPALIRLAGETQIYASPGADRLIGKAFQELGVPWPMLKVHAKLIATRQIAREVIAGERDLYRAASHIEIILWNWRPVTKDLEFLLILNNELSWDPELQRYIPEILQDEMETFARLACLTDEQIAHESENVSREER